MDNLTHSLVGGLVGTIAAKAALHRKTHRPPRSDEPLFFLAVILTSVFGNNLPDIDVVLAPLAAAFKQDPKLINLLHHRGWTHTLGAVLPLGALSAVLGMLSASFLSKSSFQSLKKFWWFLFPLGMGSVVLHILADSTNTYGVHPLAPVISNWMYGDFIFIIEPLFILAAMPWAFCAWRFSIVPVKYERVNGFFAGIFGLVFFLFWALLIWAATTRQFGVSLSSLLFFILWFGIQCILFWRIWHGTPATRRLLRSSGVLLLILGIILFTFGIAGYEVRNFFKVRYVEKGFQVLDVSSAPSPGHPLKWSVLLGGVSGAKHYEIWRAAASWNVTDLNWQLQDEALVYQERESEFRRLSENCSIRAFHHFGRFTMLKPAQNLVADARYSLRAHASFAEIEIASGPNHCPNEKWVEAAPWLSPIGRFFSPQKKE